MFQRFILCLQIIYFKLLGASRRTTWKTTTFTRSTRFSMAAVRGVKTPPANCPHYSARSNAVRKADPSIPATRDSHGFTHLLLWTSGSYSSYVICCSIAFAHQCISAMLKTTFLSEYCYVLWTHFMPASSAGTLNTCCVCYSLYLPALHCSALGRLPAYVLSGTICCK